ncbi:hypothetical protein FA95DRAFT_1556426 [Auriscalpium vulgare]|uniref:Uncharacterized protein n=1 Tax=Auriscalpium vulgare TaxID=40419 RepID=A0ACB8S0T7_9AGAM|nr:hypothetical protein FA95DRAFT_1556426 [Auriscalpium vulgare]
MYPQHNHPSPDPAMYTTPYQRQQQPPPYQTHPAAAHPQATSASAYHQAASAHPQAHTHAHPQPYAHTQPQPYVPAPPPTPSEQSPMFRKDEQVVVRLKNCGPWVAAVISAVLGITQKWSKITYEVAYVCPEGTRQRSIVTEDCVHAACPGHR